jgi:hypothetical protein
MNPTQSKQTPRMLSCACLVFPILTAAGCVMTADRQPETTPPEATTRSTSYPFPMIEPIEADTETQERSGVVVRALPTPFDVKPVPKVSCVAKPTDESQSAVFGKGNVPLIEITVNPEQESAPRSPYVLTTDTVYSVTPATLDFEIEVTNRTAQVLKLEGTILRLNIDSREVALSGEGTQPFLNAVLTPNEAMSFVVNGPEWSSLENMVTDGSTIRFTLFGVPIDVDKAGNVTERGNFVWNYRAKIDTRTGEYTHSVEEVQLTDVEAEERMCT